MAKEKEDKTPPAPVSEKSETKPEVSEPEQSSDEQETKKPEQKVPEGQMFIKVYSPFKSYFEDLATSITAANDTGPFDILAGHHGFLTLLSPCEIDIKIPDGTEVEKIKIERGIMYVKTDRVTVFLDV